MFIHNISQSKELSKEYDYWQNEKKSTTLTRLSFPNRHQMKKWNLEFNRNTVLGRTFLKLGWFFLFCFVFNRFSRLRPSVLFSLWFCIFTFVPPKCYVNFFKYFSYVSLSNFIFYLCFLSTDMFGRYAVETQNKEFAVNRLWCCSGTRFTDSQCILWSKTTHSPCTGSHSQQSKEHQIL